MASPISLTDEELSILTLTLARPHMSMTMQFEVLQKHCPLDNGRLQRENTVASHPSIGDLEVFPLEIIHSIFGILDLQSMTDLRSVSWGARALVDSFPQYSTIFRHCPDTLRALLSTHMAVHFTSGNISQALSTQSCTECGEFGPFLDLLTGHRRCLTCVVYSKHPLSTTTESAKRRYGLKNKTLLTLPTLRSLPRKYTKGKNTYRTRMRLVSTLAVVAAVAAQNNDSNASHSKRPPVYRRPLRKDTHGKNSLRFLSLIRFPALDLKTENLEWGLRCQGCGLVPLYLGRRCYNSDTVYSAAGYLEHFQKCGMYKAINKRQNSFQSVI